MSVSLPSKVIYVVDVPEVTNLKCEFSYNFHTPDERINDIQQLPKAIKQVSVDTEFLDYVRLRVPRYVTMTWKKPALASSVIVNNRSTIDIKNNLDKVLTEDTFASFDFSSVCFVDGDIENKVYSLVSGSLNSLLVGMNVNNDLTMHKLASFVSQNLPVAIDSDLLFSSVTNPWQSKNMLFFTESKPVIDQAFKDLSEVNISAQISSKLLYDMVNRGTSDPFNQYAGDMSVLKKIAKQRSQAAKKQLSTTPTEGEFKTVVPFVDIQVQRTTQQPQRYPVELIGYIVDKFEVSETGTFIEHSPLVFQSLDITSAFDQNVRYGSTYVYSVRTVAVFTMSAIDVDTQDLALLKMLVTSKQSNKVYVTTIEAIPPPPPSDLNFMWDYEAERLMVHWVFPPNGQRDIKKFQVFRRSSTKHPFELLKEYDFDDSVVKQFELEDPNPRVVERLSSPKTFYFDDEFTRQSSYIYAVCAIDAHGFTSSYSMQFQVGFDQFKNKLTKKLVSHSGAPKPYPNMYLEADALVDTIKTSGMNRMRLYLNPQNYEIVDNNKKVTQILSTTKNGGSYKLQIINLDNQLGGMVTINVADNR